MATTKQVSALDRLTKKAYAVARSDDVGYAALDITNGQPYEALSNQQVSELMDMLRDEIDAERCSHCGEKLPPSTSLENRMTRAQHSLVRYYDDVYGPNCGLS
jgi:uncharacterized protein with PIN domain